MRFAANEPGLSHCEFLITRMNESEKVSTSFTHRGLSSVITYRPCIASFNCNWMLVVTNPFITTALLNE